MQGFALVVAKNGPKLKVSQQDEPSTRLVGSIKLSGGPVGVVGRKYSMPMLARLLAKHHGFHCTVLFSLNQDNDVDPTQKIRWEDKTITHHIPGLEHLEKCDLVITGSGD